MIFDAIALLTTKATFIGVRLVVLYLLAAALGSAEFAAIAFGLTAAEIIRFIADWGVDTLSLRRFSVPDNGEASLRFKSVVPIKAGAGLAALLVSTVLLLAVSGITSPFAAILLSLTTVTSLWLNLGINWLQARGHLRRAAVLMGGFGAAALAAQFACHVANLTFEARFIVLIAFEGVMAALILHLAIGELSPLPKPVHLDSLASWLSSATPIALATILALAYSRFDQIYIRMFYPMSVLGNYVLAARIVEPVLFLMVSLTATIYARMSGLVQRGVDLHSIKHMATVWITRAFLTSSLFAILIGTVGYYYIPIYFSDYALTPYILIIILVSLPLRCVNLCLTAFIQSFGEYKKILSISFSNFFIILALVILSGHFFGYYGAACAVVLGELMNTAFQTFALIRIFKSREAVAASQTVA